MDVKRHITTVQSFASKELARLQSASGGPNPRGEAQSQDQRELKDAKRKAIASLAALFRFTGQSIGNIALNEDLAMGPPLLLLLPRFPF